MAEYIFRSLIHFLIIVAVSHAATIPAWKVFRDVINVIENTKSGTIVANFTATDADSGDEMTVTLDSIGRELFDLEPTYPLIGPSPTLLVSLYLKAELDRETKDEYAFYLTVKDKDLTPGRKDARKVILNVLDFNDNAPVFENVPYLAKVEENTAYSEIITVSAKDDDLGSNEAILYSFDDECESGDCMAFELDSTKGIVSLKSSETLDYETRNRYNLLVVAKDRGTPSLNSSTTLVIEVLDLSDQPPEFEKSSYRADVEEEKGSGTNVVKTVAHDGDRGVNNPLTYTIIKGNADGYFAIDSTSGQITLAKGIDADTGQDSFELVVQALEANSNETGNTTVYLAIQDINDNKPTFQNDSSLYSITVREDTPVGATIFFQMNAFDNDAEVVNNRFEYSISGDPENYFKIDPKIGRIDLEKALDFETKQSFNFIVTAQETDSVEKYSANQSITVTVSNVNDNQPQFNNSQFNFSISESANTGDVLGTIKATDDDIGVFGRITYSLSGFGSEMFSVDPGSGTISLTRALDFELTESYDLTLEAKDGGNSVTSVKVVITVLDANDNTPVFDASPVSATLKEENQDPGFTVQVKATDKDANVIQYSIIDGDPSNQFAIDATTGVISTRGPLDYEVQNEYNLVIMAKDQGQPPLNTTRTLQIIVQDVNDNAPYFNQSLFNVDLVENADIDVAVVRLFAFDDDDGKNAELVYSIIDGNEGKIFLIDSDGLISTRGSPDREKTSVYTLNISVSDLGEPKKFAYAKVVVNILDENDAAPKFSIIVEKKSLKEGPSSLNAMVASHTAVDGDEGLNGTILYTIGDGNTMDKFTIDADTGVVTVASELDFEEVRIYSLKIVASDRGTPSLSGEYQLVVEVIDINDNSPEFGQPEYSFSISENRPEKTPIVTLRADDKDNGLNKLITYTIVYGNIGNAFAIHNETGEISTMAILDREKRESYLLVVKAEDHGSPSLFGTTNVTISVLDVNDEIPQFSQPSYNISVPEDSPKGTSVFTLFATDDDAGPAGQVSFQMQDIGNLENGNNVFMIGSQSGEVKTNIKLDFEIHRTFTLTVTARDNGAPVLTSNATLNVVITDVDDNAPVFTQSAWTAAVNENAADGAPVITLYATDADHEVLHRTILYRMGGGNDGDVFGIWRENGTVYIADGTNLDRETKNVYELTIIAETLDKDNETAQESSTKLTITVDDYNDFAPKFPVASYVKKIPESFELNEDVVTVTAEDKDIGVNGIISYSIVNGNDEGIFQIDNVTGVVTIVEKLDRETKDVHNLTIKAKDQGVPSLESTVLVIISVTDTNDMKPVLTLQGNAFSVAENSTVGTFVTQFSATDGDLNKNAEVGFQIVSGNDAGKFVLNKTTGVLSTAMLLDYENTREYQLGIQAYDHGTPNLQSDVKIITVNIIDVNDNPPVFSAQKSVTMTVMENLSQDAVVGTVLAQDSDETDKFYYYIRGGNGVDYFSVDETTGVITTTKSIDREATSSLFIYVQVFNLKQSQEFIRSLGPIRKRRSVDTNITPIVPSDDSIQLVIIEIGDKNDNPPVFEHSSYKAGVSQDAKHETEIMQITCDDQDIGNNSRLVYSMADLPDGLLELQSDTGWISVGTQTYFANKVGTTYTFTYTCSDGMASDTTNVTIFVVVADQSLVRLTLNQNDTGFVRDNIDEIIKGLNEATGLEFISDSIQYHLQPDQKYNTDKVDIFMYAVDPKSNEVVDKETALSLIDRNYARLLALFTTYKVDAVEPKKADDDGADQDLALIAAIVLGIILFIILLCFLCVICLMRRSHNRKLRAAKATGAQDSNYGLATPGTNLHVYEGSNPIWMDPYDNWRPEDDNNSKVGKLYEAQELSMDMFQDSPGHHIIPGTFYESTSNSASYHPNGILHLDGLESDVSDETVTNI